MEVIIQYLMNLLLIILINHALQNPQPAIIHHFAFYEDTSKFSFPDFSAGWPISSTLLVR